MPKILIVDDEPRLRKVLSLQLESAGYETEQAEDGQKALSLVNEVPLDCVITDLRMPNMSGEELLKEIQKINPSLPVILLTAHGTVQAAVKAMREGAVDFLEKPYNQDDLHKAVQRAIERKTVILENLFLRSELELESGKVGLVGDSAPLKSLTLLIERVARSNSTALILGESGSGKELVARAIHNLSPRSSHPFVPINCIAIPDELLESTLFGHVKGAFTGAHQNRVGSFELADRGTLFLDEIGDMNQNLQGKILRVLQEQTIEPVGGRGSKKVDVRVVAATNRNLEQAVREGRFREDLYFRLNVVPIQVPPLREHRSDIPMLVKHFLKELGKNPQDFPIPAHAIEVMMKYHWPGNVRELRNVVERAVVLDSPEMLAEIGTRITTLPDKQPEPDSFDFQLPGDNLTYKEAKEIVLDRFERGFFKKVLEKNRGNVSRTAEFLGMHRKNLQEKLDRLGLNPKSVLPANPDENEGESD